MIKTDRPLLGFDLETTGVDVERDRIVQIGIVTWKGRGVRLVNPMRPIPPEATAVHGITDDDVHGAETFHDQAQTFFDAMTACDLVGFNCKKFDIPFLSSEFAAAGYTWPMPDQRVIDVHRIFKRREPHTLDAAVRRYLRREHEGSHKADADAAATMEILNEQAELYGLHTIDDMIEAMKDPEWVDDEGKFVDHGNGIEFNFSKHKGEPLAVVESGMLAWMLKNDFQRDAKLIAARELLSRDGLAVSTAEQLVDRWQQSLAHDKARELRDEHSNEEPMYSHEKPQL